MNKDIRNYLTSIILLLLCSIHIACANNKKESTQQATSGSVIIMTDSLFRSQVFDYQSGSEAWQYLGEKPAIIDFYADWCGPCRAIAPILKELATEYKDSLIIYKVNVDKERTLAGWAGIQSIPAVLFVPMKEHPQMMIGQQSKETYIEAIQKLLLK